MSEYPSLHGGAAGEPTLSPAQGRQLGRILEAVARWSVYLSVLLLPVFYLPYSTDPLEFNKQALLIVLATLGTLAWLGKMLVARRVEFRRSVMNLLIGVYVVIYALAAWFSHSRYTSLVGDFGQENAGLVTLVAFVLLYFIATNNLKDRKEVKNVVMFLMFGGLLAVIQTYLQALGLRALVGAAAQSGSFNLVGTSNALGVYLAMVLAMTMGMLLMPDTGKLKLVKKVLLGILGALSLLYIASLSFWAIWLVLILGSAVLVVYGLLKTEKVKQVTMLAIPMAVIVIGIVFIFIRFPITLGAPAEVMPSLRASWGIARDALASHPILGSGPGTFLYDYAQFRSKDLNSTDFWNIQFDRSSSRLLTLLATTGILGIAAFLVMALYLGARVKYRLWKEQEDDWLLTLTILSGWVALFVGKFLYSSNTTLEFLFWMLTALLVISEWGRWSEARFESSPRAALVLSFCFIVAVIFSIAGLYLEGQRYAGELHYTAGVTRTLNKPEDVDASVNDLIRANQLNTQNDLYVRTLSQALTLKTNLEVQKVGAKPTADDARNIAVLAANAVNAGKQATDLNPANVLNWSSLASLYRDLIGSTPGAADAAEKAYEQTIQLEPNSPEHYTDLGRVELAVADSLRAQLANDKDPQKTTDTNEMNDRLAKAADNFNKAVDLKSDYAPALYWTAVTLDRQGKADEALAKLEAVRNLTPNDLGVGFQLGILYYQNNKKDQAIAEMERVISLSPQYSNARWYLAAMYEDAGRLDDAIAQVEQVLKYNPNDDLVKKRLADLQAKKSGQPVPAQPGLPNPVEEPNAGQVIPPNPAPAPAQ